MVDSDEVETSSDCGEPADDEEEISADDEVDDDEEDSDDEDDDDNDSQPVVDLAELSDIFKLGNSFSPEVQKSMLWVRTYFDTYFPISI